MARQKRTRQPKTKFKKNVCRWCGMEKFPYLTKGGVVWMCPCTKTT
jgi:hypothetical protein